MIHDNRFEFEKVERPQVWLNLVGRGSKWRAGVGYLPPTHASALKSGKTGVLGADGEPDISPQGRKLTDEEKAKIAKTDKEMQEAEIGKPFESKKYQRAVAKAEKSIEKDKVETAIILDGDGRVIEKISQGHESSVEFSIEQIMAMKGKTITHNHPGGRSLSSDDFVVLALSGAKEMRAIGSNGISYSARVDKEWKFKSETQARVVKPYGGSKYSSSQSNQDKVKSALEQQEKKVKVRMWKLIDDGKITHTEADLLHGHIVNREFAKQKTNPVKYSVSGNPEALANLSRLEKLYDGD